MGGATTGCSVNRVAPICIWPGRHQLDHVARITRLHGVPVLPESGVGVLGRERLAGLRVGDDHPALEPSGTDPHERDPVAVRAVRAGLDLEHLPGERRVDRARLVGLVGARRRWRGELDHGVEQAAYPEIGQRGPEQHGCGGAGVVGGQIQVGPDLAQQGNFLNGLPPRLALLGGCLLGRHRLFAGDRGAARGAVEAGVLVALAVEDAAEIAGDADRPGQRGRAKPDALFDLVQQFERWRPGRSHLFTKVITGRRR